VSDLPTCPLGDCEIPTPHSHPLLGEGCFGPRATGSRDFARVSIATVQLPARCPRCGATFEATVLVLDGHAAPTAPIVRTCDACLDVAEAACLARTPRP